MHPEFAPVAFISAISVLVVLPWHWRAGNIATLAIAFWLFVTNIIYGVDASIWGDNVEILIPVWCDITTKLIIGTNFGLPSACLCLCIHLEQVASIRLVRTTPKDRRRRQIFESLMCFGLPLLFMGLHFIVQGHRFDIIEEYGCRPTTYFSIAALFIVWLPPLVVTLVTFVFAGLALRHFMLRRITFAAHLGTTGSALTTSRYLRLMLMAVLQMIWSVTVTSYALWFTAMAVPIRPWTTWNDVHSDFSRIDLYPKAFTPKVVLTSYYILWWMVPVSTVIFVAFFAFGRDAVEEYKKCFVWFRTTVLRQCISTESKAKASFVGLSKSWSFRISSPRLFKNTTSTSSPLPSYSDPNSPPSPSNFKNDLDDSNYDSRSDISHYASQDHHTISIYSYGPKAIGSLTDLSSALTPSTLTPPISLTQSTWSCNSIPLTSLPPPSPSPSPHARVCRNQSPTSPRPDTYPSHDSSYIAATSPLDHA